MDAISASRAQAYHGDPELLALVHVLFQPSPIRKEQFINAKRLIILLSSPTKYHIVIIEKISLIEILLFLKLI